MKNNVTTFWKAGCIGPLSPLRHRLALLALLALLLVPHTMQAQFAPAVSFAAGYRNYPVGVTTADLDGDGRPDMVVANNDSNTAGVRLNTTPVGATIPSFGAALTFAGGGTNTLGVTVADVNGDGRPDLVVANAGSSAVGVLRNTTAPGSTTVVFAPAVSFGTGGSFPYNVAVADLNGDGRPDLLTANYYSSGAGVLLNTTPAGATTPTFASATNFASGSNTNPVSVAAADVNGDGKPDLLVSNTGTDAVAVLLNTMPAGATTPTFGPATTFTTGSNRYPQGIATADINGDGRLDLLVATSGNHTASVLLNTTPAGASSASFAACAPFSVGSGAGTRGIAAADVNGDGRPDLLTANYSNETVSVLVNTTATGATAASFAPVAAFAAGSGSQPFSIAAADVNGDGKPDLLSANYGGNDVGVLLNQYAASPALSSLSAPSGAVGTTITLTGTSLTGATAVSFNGTAATFAVVNATTITATVPTGATTGPVTVTTPGGTSNGVAFTVTYPDLVISTGTTAAPVAVAAGTYNSITVTGTGYASLGGAVVVNSAVSISGSLATNCQALTGAGSFTLAAGATLYICDANGISPSGSSGAVQTTGLRSFSTDASYVYTGTQAQSTGTGLPATVRNLTAATSGGDLFLTLPVAIRQVLALPTASNFNLNNQPLLLLSDASGTALVANTGGGQVLGRTATLQRHIETNAAANGYRHYASPMVATAGAETLATLATAGYTPDFSGAAAYNTSPTPGRVTPFPTVLLYNQDRIATTTSNYDTFGKGWQAALGSDVPQVGRGYSVQIAGAALVDFTGQLSSGSVSRANLQRASADPATGWHLLGNPFPSPLDWSTMTVGTTAAANLQNMDGAVYVYQSSGPYTGSYRAYLAGAPGNSSPLIPAGSGFFVHTTAPATPGLVRFNANNRVTTFGAQPAFGRSNDLRPVLTLALAGATTDAVTLYFDPAATPGVDAAYDAVKLPNPSGLNLAVLNGSTPLAIAGMPAPTTTTLLPLTLAVPTAGPYTLRVAELTNFAALPVYLRDAQAGTEQLLTPGYAVSLTLAAGSTSRFSLVLRPAGALATAGPVLAAQASIYPNPAHGAFTLTLPPVAGATKATATLFNTLGQVVSTRTLALSVGGATATYATAGLAAGVYALRLTAGGETATLRVVVE